MAKEKVEAVEVAEVEEYTGARRDVVSAVSGLNNAEATFYSSIKGDSFAGRVAIANAMSNSKPVMDVLGETINLVDYIVQVVQIADDKTAEVNDAARVTLVDDKGMAYHATSDGLLSAIRTLNATVGEPSTWPEPLPIKVVEERSRKGFRFMTIKFA